MSGFIRRFTQDPGLAEILRIEGIVIIDREPPSTPTGVGSGSTSLIGEFEDGPFNVPTEVFSGPDMQNIFGGFGYVYEGVASNNPCARARRVDGTITPEYWNGNGFIALRSKVFSRLFITRVDTSVGEVSFTRLPSVVGNALFSWSVANSSTLVIFKSITDQDTATFTGAAAVRATAAGTYPTTFVGGETVTLTIDEGTQQQIGPVTVTFQSTDSTQAAVIARINAALGYTAAATVSATVFNLTGRVLGNTGNVRVNAVSGALVTTATGLTVGATAGTGNVGNLAAVSFAEAKAVIEAAVDLVRVDRDSNQNIRISLLTGSEIYVVSTSTAADAFGFPTQQTDQEPSGAAFLYSAAGTYPTTFAGGETLTLGFDGDQNVTVTFLVGDQTQAQVMSRINAAFTRTVVTGPSATRLRFVGLANGGNVRVVAGTSLVLTALGLSIGSNVAYTHADTKIPAGTRVRNASGVEWVTMQTIDVTPLNAGPYSVKVRPGLDDGTIGSAAGATVTTIPYAIAGAAYSVNNTLGLSAALSEGEIDAKYLTAFNATLSTTSPVKQANLSVSARASNAIRVAGRQNALDASAQGMFGRVFFMRPPLGTTTRAQAKSQSSQPGSGAYRSQRVVYNYPGANILVPEIASRGLSGGAGFTADGLIDVGSDTWAATICSQLPPEENPGQDTSFALSVLSLERGNPDVQNLTMGDYESFKAAGIMAPRMEQGRCIFQSGIVNLDPLVYPALTSLNRQRFSDFIGDTLAAFSLKYVKKMMTRKRRSDLLGSTTAFGEELQSASNPDLSRIDSYRADGGPSVNTSTAIAAGVYRIKFLVKMNPDFLDIVFDLQVGPTVNTLEQVQ